MPVTTIGCYLATGECCGLCCPPCVRTFRNWLSWDFVHVVISLHVRECRATGAVKVANAVVVVSGFRCSVNRCSSSICDECCRCTVSP